MRIHLALPLATASWIISLPKTENSWQVPLNVFANKTLKLFVSRYVNKLQDKSGPSTCYLECSHVRNMVWKIYVDCCFESLESSFTLFKHKQCNLAKRKRNIGEVWNVLKTEKKIAKTAFISRMMHWKMPLLYLSTWSMF